MSNKTKRWLIAAASLILIGCMMFGGVMTMYKWDFKKLSTAKYETNSYEINETYKNISICTDTADIVFVPSENAKIVCYEQKHVKHLVSVKDNTLTIEAVDTRKWYEYIGFHFATPHITVQIPEGEYGMLSIRNDTGDVTIPENFAFQGTEIKVSTGRVTNEASVSENLKIKTSTGNICAENISATNM